MLGFRVAAAKLKSENCLPPNEIGPDYDFGASPILVSLGNGHRMLVAGQKSGMVWGHDPDREGTVAWKAQLVKKLALGMITFGGASDDQNLSFLDSHRAALPRCATTPGSKNGSRPSHPRRAPAPKVKMRRSPRFREPFFPAAGTA